MLPRVEVKISIGESDQAGNAAPEPVGSALQHITVTPNYPPQVPGSAPDYGVTTRIHSLPNIIHPSSYSQGAEAGVSLPGHSITRRDFLRTLIAGSIVAIPLSYAAYYAADSIVKSIRLDATKEAKWKEAQETAQKFLADEHSPHFSNIQSIQPMNIREAPFTGDFEGQIILKLKRVKAVNVVLVQGENPLPHETNVLWFYGIFEDETGKRYEGFGHSSNFDVLLPKP